MSYFVSIIFFFKHKTAYEMRISDWSSDVCSSDLFAPINVKLVAEDMVISNPEWATQDQFFTADRIEARIATFSLLTSNNRINWLHLINGKVNLEWEKGKSEEHTSELQSLMRMSYAVFYLKKKKSRTTCVQSLKQTEILRNTL